METNFINTNTNLSTNATFWTKEAPDAEANNVQNQVNDNVVDNKHTKNGDTITIFNKKVKKSTAIVGGLVGIGAICLAVLGGKHFIASRKMANEIPAPKPVDFTGDGGSTDYLDVVETSSVVKHCFDKDNNLVGDLKNKNGKLVDSDNEPFNGIMRAKNQLGEVFELKYEDGRIVKSEKNGEVLKEYFVNEQTQASSVNIYENGEIARVMVKSKTPSQNATCITKYNKNGIVDEYRLFDDITRQLIQEGSLDASRTDITKDGCVIVEKNGINYLFSPNAAFSKIDDLSSSSSCLKALQIEQKIDDNSTKVFSQNYQDDVEPLLYSIRFNDGSEIGLNRGVNPRFCVKEKINNHIGSLSGNFYIKKEGESISYFSSVIDKHHACKNSEQKQAMLDIYAKLAPDEKVAQHYRPLDYSTERQASDGFLSTRAILSREGIEKAMETQPFAYNKKLVDIFANIFKEG